MKKVLISFGSVLILAFVMVLFVSANTSSPDKDKKVKNQVKKEQVATHCSSTCNHSATCDKCTACDPAKCKEKGCTHEVGSCDPKTCKKHVEKGCKEGTCSGTCKGKGK